MANPTIVYRNFSIVREDLGWSAMHLEFTGEPGDAGLIWKPTKSELEPAIDRYWEEHADPLREAPAI